MFNNGISVIQMINTMINGLNFPNPNENMNMYQCNRIPCYKFLKGSN